MRLFDVYGKFPISPVRGEGAWIWDADGRKILDFYGGHGVISIGHQHPVWVAQIGEQLNELSFYSNAVHNPLQEALAERIGELSGLQDYQLFLCNSGAEANENALKAASWATGRKKVVAVEKAFHGRTCGTLSVTDNSGIRSPFNEDHHDVTFIPMNDHDAATKAIDRETAAVVIEGIQGVAGINVPTNAYLEYLLECCRKTGAKLILDEVQSGAGRSGHYFAFQTASVQPDLVSVAKGFGNGFPVAAVLIHNSIEPWKGMLGTTFGGNHLACRAAIAVHEVIRDENLMDNASDIGSFIASEAGKLSDVEAVKGKGLMLGFRLPVEAKAVQLELLKNGVIVGNASDAAMLRILPPLNITEEQASIFLEAFEKSLKQVIQTQQVGA